MPSPQDFIQATQELASINGVWANQIIVTATEKYLTSFGFSINTNLQNIAQENYNENYNTLYLCLDDQHYSYITPEGKQDVPADGNCFFNAVIQALHSRGYNSNLTTDVLRKNISVFIGQGLAPEALSSTMALSDIHPKTPSDAVNKAFATWVNQNCTQSFRDFLCNDEQQQVFLQNHIRNIKEAHSQSNPEIQAACIDSLRQPFEQDKAVLSAFFTDDNSPSIYTHNSLENMQTALFESPDLIASLPDNIDVNLFNRIIKPISLAKEDLNMAQYFLTQLKELTQIIQERQTYEDNDINQDIEEHFKCMVKDLFSYEILGNSPNQDFPSIDNTNIDDLLKTLNTLKSTLEKTLPDPESTSHYRYR